MHKKSADMRHRCELAELVRCYIANAKNTYESTHWMNIRCSLAHLTMHARDLSWASIHAAALDVASDIRSTPDYRRQVLAIWRQFFATRSRLASSRAKS